MDYKKRYKALKRHLKTLLYEQDAFQEELEQSQRTMLRVARDKSFLLSRLLKYEDVSDESSPDSDATLPSDSEEAPKPRKRPKPQPKSVTAPTTTITTIKTEENSAKIQLCADMKGSTKENLNEPVLKIDTDIKSDEKNEIKTEEMDLPAVEKMPAIKTEVTT